MPWFIYNYPGNPFSESSYTFVDAPPICSGVTLCTVNTNILPDTDRPSSTRSQKAWRSSCN